MKFSQRRLLKKPLLKCYYLITLGNNIQLLPFNILTFNIQQGTLLMLLQVSQMRIRYNCTSKGAIQQNGLEIHIRSLQIKISHVRCNGFLMDSLFITTIKKQKKKLRLLEVKIESNKPCASKNAFKEIYDKETIQFKLLLTYHLILLL